MTVTDPGRPTVDRWPLPFTAASPTRTAPLTWAQQHLLLLIDELAPMTETLNVRFRVDLRPSLTSAQVLVALRHLVETFDALRTVILRPEQGPLQQVLGSGELTVEVVDLPAGPADASRTADALTTADEAVDRLGSKPFDITGELPVRAVLVTVDGRPRHLALTLSHLSVDHTGAGWAQAYLRTSLARPQAAARAPESAWSPLDEVAWEESPAGRRHGERAVEQQATVLAAMPQTMLPRAVGPFEGLRYRYLQFDSPALALATAALAARHRVSPTAVLHAGLCAVAAHVSRLDRAFLQLTVGNRVARNRLAVGMHTEDVPVAVDLAGAGMAELIERSGVALPQAVRFGQYPPAARAARRREIELERGIHADLTCWLNDRRNFARTARSTDAPSRPELARAAERTAWRWVEGSPNSTSTYFVFADDADDALRLTVIVDSAVLPTAEAVGWLQALERLLCATVTGDVDATGPDGPIGLPRAPEGDGWALVDHSRAHLPSVAAAVRRVSGARAADVFTEPTPDGDRLVAVLSGDALGGALPSGALPSGALPDLSRLHSDLVAGLPGVRTVVAPHRYEIRAGAPGEGGLAAWRRLPLLAGGSGRAVREGQSPLR